MTRRQLTKSIKRILIVLEENNVFEVFDSLITGRVEKDKNSAADFLNAIEALKRYSIAASSFTDNEREIISLFDLNDLESPAVWQTILLAQVRESRNAMTRRVSKIHFGLKDIKRFLPKFIEIIDHDEVNVLQLPKEDRPESLRNKEILTIILHEEKNNVSTPERLIEALDAIKVIYETCSIIEKYPSNDLSVIAIDSGSDKSFDFLGAAKIIECTKDFIFALWDRVVFFREKKMHERLDLIAKSLPIIERISELEKSGSLGSEQCEILRRNVFQGSNKFLSAGIIIPELEEKSQHNPKSLLSPETKLLAQKNNENNEDATDVEFDEVSEEYSSKEDLSDDFDDYEIKLLKEILRKKMKKKSKKSPKKNEEEE